MATSANGHEPIPLDIDDGTGLRVVYGEFLRQEKFTRDLFEGYDKIRILTYTASLKTVIGMLDEHSFDEFECVFGFVGTLGKFSEIIAVQQFVKEGSHAAIMGLQDERHVRILEQIHSGRASFRVLRKGISHTKLYLLSSSTDDRRRVVTGSANLSEQAFSGNQAEEIVVFDNQDDAWEYYNKKFNQIRDSASDEIPLPEERIKTAKIDFSDVPVLNEPVRVVVAPPTDTEERESIVDHVERVQEVAKFLEPRIASVLPSMRNGKQTITPKHLQAVKEMRLVKSADEADHKWFSIDRAERTAELTGDPFPLEWDGECVKTDAQLILEYFKNYEDAFEFKSDVPGLQSDYFKLMSWLYFSPFMCDMRSLAQAKGKDVIRYPSFAIVHGKSNCGKTSLIETLMMSMFGEKYERVNLKFTTTQLRSIQQAYRRFPVVLDDVGKKPFNEHRPDVIKNEMPLPVLEYPGFILSMNKDNDSFRDEVVKRSFMVYTTAALPNHDEELRISFSDRIKEIRELLTGHLYRRYLQEVMGRLEREQLPGDWLALSSGVLSSIILDSMDQQQPDWCRETTYLEYAATKYNRIRARLRNLLSESARGATLGGSTTEAWNIEGDRIVVLEETNSFGRRPFRWDAVPDYLIDENACVGGKTVLYAESLEDFIEQDLRYTRPWWKPW